MAEFSASLFSLARGIGRWLKRLIPLIGYIYALEQENAALKAERDALLNRLIQITTGAPLLGASVPAPQAQEPEAAPDPVRDELRELERRSAESYLQRLRPITSFEQYQHYIETGELPPEAPAVGIEPPAN